MNHGKYVFSQLVEFLPQRVFDRFVVKYDGNKSEEGVLLHFLQREQCLLMKSIKPIKIRTQIYRIGYWSTVNTLPKPENLLLNMEKKDWKTRLRQLGLAGVLFFTVKGILTLTLGGWLLTKLGCGE